MKGSSSSENKKLANSSSEAKLRQKFGDVYVNQITVLKCMFTPATQTCPPMTIPEITEACGIKDDKEVLRYLYILEGQKLVSPYPSGDFTAKHWQLTSEGTRALKVINTAMAA